MGEPKGKARRVVGTTPGTIDYRDERFVARFPYDASLVAELKTLRQGPRQRASDEWIIERHRPSVARLVRIARDRSWHFTAEARKALQQLQDQADAAVFSLDVVQGNAGEPWFLCMCGDDYDLQQRVKSLPGAFLDDADDSWWVPADSEAACADLLEIVEGDDRIEVSAAALRLLEEPESEVVLARSSAAPMQGARPTGAADDAGLPAGTWDPTELDYQMHALSSATREDDFKVSPALRGTLLPFQIAGVRYLCSASRAVLADEHGLGKSVQALATIETLGAYPALIVCPSPLRLSWLREAQRWLPAGKTLAMLAAPLESLPMVDVLIVGYEALAGHQQLLEERGFEAIVADESHYLKSRDTPRTQAAIAIANSVPSLRLCLSSRPYGSQPVDIAGQLAFLGVLDAEFGGFWPFASRYCAPKDDGGAMRFGAARTDELAQRLRSTCYCRREKVAVRAQLPEHARAVHWLELDDRAAYARVEEEAREALRGLAAHQAAEPQGPAALDALRQKRLARVHDVLHACGQQKTASIARWVANFLSTGEPLVVFAQHPDVLAALRESFPRALAIGAADAPLQRDRAVRAFQSGEAQLIICALHAEGAAAALTRARHVAFAELAWSAAPRDQALARIHRIGAERSAMAWYLVGDGTIDELVLEVVSRRRVAAGELHESVLLEVADEIARMTAPRPVAAEPAPITKLTKIVG